MTAPTDSDKQGKDEAHGLELEVEEVADLELPKEVTDEVRGASGTPVTTGKVVGKQNC